MGLTYKQRVLEDNTVKLYINGSICSDKIGGYSGVKVNATDGSIIRDHSGSWTAGKMAFGSIEPYGVSFEMDQEKPRAAFENQSVVDEWQDALDPFAP